MAVRSRFGLMEIFTPGRRAAFESPVQMTARRGYLPENRCVGE